MIERVYRRRQLLASGAVAVTALSARPAIAQGTVSLLEYHTSVPDGWVARAPASTSRLAEYVVKPRGAMKDSAEVVVYFFGKSQGGNVEANLTRWKAQFSTTDGSPVPETITRDSTPGFPITFAEYRGTYARGIGAGDPNAAKPNQELLAAIAETPRGTMFIQLFGPADRVVGERDVLMRFVKGLK